MRAAADPEYPAEIVLVLSSRADAGGLGLARAAGIEALVFSAGDYPDAPEREKGMHAALVARQIDLVCLAGYMRILSPEFVQLWQGRMINIHPSLLPAFKGTNTHARALAAGSKVHGATVHFVTAEMDAGPVICQAEVPVLPSDTPDTLAARVLEVEHRLYPQALRLVAEGRAVFPAS